MVISESKKRVMISLTKEQDKKLTDMAKQKGFSKSAVAALAIEEYARKESEQKNKRKLAFLEGYEFSLLVFDKVIISWLLKILKLEILDFYYILTQFLMIGKKN